MKSKKEEIQAIMDTIAPISIGQLHNQFRQKDIDDARMKLLNSATDDLSYPEAIYMLILSLEGVIISGVRKGALKVTVDKQENVH